MSCRPVTRWLFGKLPALGDFVSRGIERDVRDSLDIWLSAAMETARNRFDDFDVRYDMAPAWNFVHQDDSGDWSGGALCASVDRAGRRFPLIMAAPAANVGEAVAQSGACLDVLYAALAEGWDADDLYSVELVPADLPWNPHATEWALLSEDGPAFTVTERFPGGIISVMLEMAL